MRTTLVISTPVFNRAKKFARERGIRLSALATEAMEQFLISNERANAGSKKRHIKLTPFEMGVPQVDLNDREKLFRRMEEG